MTPRSIISKADLMGVAEVAKQTGCVIEIKRGDVTIMVNGRPESEASGKGSGKIDGLDYTRPDL